MSATQEREQIDAMRKNMDCNTLSTLRTASTLSRRCLYRPAMAISKQGPSLATLERITCRSSSSTPSLYSLHLPAPYYSSFSSFSSFSGAFTLSRSISRHLTLLDTSEQFFFAVLVVCGLHFSSVHLVPLASRSPPCPVYFLYLVCAQLLDFPHFPLLAVFTNFYIQVVPCRDSHLPPDIEDCPSQ
jgi:hypothetical protein